MECPDLMTSWKTHGYMMDIEMDFPNCFTQIFRWSTGEQIFEEFSQNWSNNYVPFINMKMLRYLEQNLYHYTTILHENVTGKSVKEIKDDLMKQICVEDVDKDMVQKSIYNIVNFLFGERHSQARKFPRSLFANKISSETNLSTNHIIMCHQKMSCEALTIFVHFILGNNAQPSDNLLVLFFPSNDSNEKIVKQMGQCAGRLLMNMEFYQNCISATEKEELLMSIEKFVNATYLVLPQPTNDYFRLPEDQMVKVDNKILEYHDVIRKHEKIKRGEEQEIQVEKKSNSFKHIFRGLKEDINNRSKFYISDFVDGFDFQIIISTIYMYFASLAPIITFGGLLSEATEGNLGTIESLVSGTICSIIYSIFSGQPLTILGSTGPVLVFESIIFQLCKQYQLYYLSFRLWIGIWISVILFLFVAFNISDLVKYITKFTEECFATLISVIYIFEAINNLIITYKTFPLFRRLQKGINQSYTENLTDAFVKKITKFEHNYQTTVAMNLTNMTMSSDSQAAKYLTNLHSAVKSNGETIGGTTEDTDFSFNEVQSNIFLFSLSLAIGTYVLAMILKKIKMLKIFPSLIRNFVFDAAVIMSIVLLTIIDFISFVETPKLHIPQTFQPTLGLKTRNWFIFPFNGNPIWTAPAAVLPALLAVILLFLDQQITATIINKDANLKKGCGYHLDLLVLSLLILINSLLGTPWFVAATLLSICHKNSLRYHSDIPKFREQRVSGILIGITVGMTILLTPILKLIPMSIFYGVLLIMGFSSLGDVEFVQRIRLLLTPYRDKPDYLYLRYVKIKRIHLYTIIQLISFLVIWLVKSFTYISILFPFMVLAMCFIRKLLENVFTNHELYWLDDLYPGTTFINSKEFSDQNTKIIEGPQKAVYKQTNCFQQVTSSV